ncbi:MAG: response regulator [Desulfobacterales bacterium]|nr:response regulator [Desulfobacterales bacterium]
MAKELVKLKFFFQKIELRMMQGEISVNSQIGIGSEFMFTVRISVQSSCKDDPNALIKYNSEVISNTSTDSRIEVLVVDDHEINREIVFEILTPKGIQVTLVKNGYEAIEKIKQNSHYALILMDIQMPGMDGFETTRIIREELKLTKLPIIALSALSTDNDISKCFELGMNDYISKPFNEIKLLNALYKWVTPNSNTDTISLSQTSIIPLSQHNIARIQGIDFNLGLENLGNNLQLYKNVLKLFLNNHKNFYQKFKENIQIKNSDEAYEIIHGIKGVSGNIGANSIYESAKNIESLLRKNDLEHIHELLPALEQQVTQVFNAITEWIYEKNSSHISVNGFINQEVLKSLMNEFAESLASNHINAYLQVNELKKHLTDYQDEIALIEHHVLQLDYESAWPVLQALAKKINIILN